MLSVLPPATHWCEHDKLCGAHKQWEGVSASLFLSSTTLQSKAQVQACPGKHPTSALSLSRDSALSEASYSFPAQKSHNSTISNWIFFLSNGKANLLFFCSALPVFLNLSFSAYLLLHCPPKNWRWLNTFFNNRVHFFVLILPFKSDKVLFFN